MAQTHRAAVFFPDRSRSLQRFGAAMPRPRGPRYVTRGLGPSNRRDSCGIGVESFAPMEDGESLPLLASPQKIVASAISAVLSLGKEVRWVSYHFESDSEVLRVDDDVMHP